MNLDRLRWGEWIAAIAALDLLVVTFRAWYKVTGTGAHVTAWDALDNGRYLLIATAIVGIFLWLIKAAEDTQQLSFEPGWIAAAVGLICTVYVAYRLASPPSDALDPTVGIYLGLISALGVTIGGLLSARQAAPSHEAARGGFAAGATGPRGGATGPLTPETNPTWSPASPAASTTGWSPAAAVAVPPATAAGAALGGAGERPLQSGDHVVLTAGGARYPAGTLAQVIEVFGGGALVEVKAADGMAERFEVPEQAYERAPAGGAGQPPASGQNWSPALPAAAGQDWGFEEQPANGAAAADAHATATGVDESPAEKVPWWKREIGGGKKNKGEEALALGGAAAAGAAAAKLADRNGSSEEKPSFFTRLFGGGKKEEPETEALDAQPAAEDAPAGGVAGSGEAAESDTAVAEPASAVDDTPTEPTGSAAPSAGESAAAAAAGGAAAAAASDESATPASDPESAGASPSGAEPGAASSGSAPESDASPSMPAASEPAASDQAASSAAASEPSASPAESEAGLGVGGAGIAAAGAGAAAGAAAAPPGSDKEAGDAPKPKPSSGNRKVPKEVLAGAGVGDAQPKVGDEVQLKVGGGK
ncbi:MAG TPA: hypothetical protein VH300_04335, partial [Thermoleophilaceae bacterium]|nr:hypothetical protein [Thermoleophilaceae bacterium]